MLPPGSGWKTLRAGLSPTAGCGVDPPPASVQAVAAGAPTAVSPPELGSEAADRLAASGNGCSGILPRFIDVAGAGCADVNGTYSFSGIINNRPFYKLSNGPPTPSKAENQTPPAIWYFATCPLAKSTGGTVSYNGWYISRDAQTSSYSAAADMYCLYSPSAALPLDSDTWVVRPSGIGPTSGCGVAPAPRVTATAVDKIRAMGSSVQVVILRISLPNGIVVTMVASELVTVSDVKRWIDVNHKQWRLYDLQLKVGGHVLADPALCIAGAVSPGGLLVAEENAAAHCILAAPVTAPPKTILVVGAGPVGSRCAYLIIVLLIFLMLSCVVYMKGFGWLFI